MPILIGDSGAVAWANGVNASVTALFAADATHVVKGTLIRNVTDYGATGNGSTDDTAAINAAITAANGSGQVLINFPNGTYKVSSSVTVPAGVSLVGQNAVILSSFAAGDVFTLGDTCRISGFKFATSVTRTSGACILITGAQCYADHLAFTGNIFIGIQLGTTATKAIASRVSNLTFFTMTNSLTNAGGIFLCNVSDARVEAVTGTGVNPTGQVDYGIRIWEGDTWYIRDANMVRMGRALLIDTPSGKSTFAGRIVGGMFDSAGTGPGAACNSAEIIPAGYVYDLNITGTWFGGSVSQAGLYVIPSGSGVVDGIGLTGCEFVSNGYAGARFIGANVKNWTITGGEALGNTNYGVDVGGATTNWIINGLRSGVSGVHPGPQSYGVNIQAAAQTGYVVSNCNLRGNTSTALYDGTTGSPSRLVTNNLLV